MAMSYMARPVKIFLIRYGLLGYVLDYCPLWLASLLHGSDLSLLVDGEAASPKDKKASVGGKTVDAASIEELSAVPAPRHIAAIMDGNRRYGKVGACMPAAAGAGCSAAERWRCVWQMKWGNALKGHWAGGDKLNEFTDWCSPPPPAAHPL